MITRSDLRNAVTALIHGITAAVCLLASFLIGAFQEGPGQFISAVIAGGLFLLNAFIAAHRTAQIGEDS